MNIERERLFIETFVVRSKRDRYVTLLGNSKTRPKILGLLNHNLDVDWTLAIEAKTHDLAALEAFLRSLGAPNEGCYFISDSTELDGTTVSLGKALRLADDFFFASILDYVPGKLAVYWCETATKPRCYVLLKKH